MQIGHRQIFEQSTSALEGRVGFTGKTDQNINSEGSLGHEAYDFSNEFFEESAGIGPIHFLQDAVIPALERYVKMGADSAGSAPGIRHKAKQLSLIHI